MAKVTSSNLDEVSYDFESGVLEIKFLSGATYRYKDVPVRIYHGLMAAESHGSFFNEVVKDQYKFYRVER